jgi:hypothetical protein
MKMIVFWDVAPRSTVEIDGVSALLDASIIVTLLTVVVSTF